MVRLQMQLGVGKAIVHARDGSHQLPVRQTLAVAGGVRS